MLAASWILARLAGGTVYRILGRISGHDALTELARKVTRFAVLVGGFVVALQVLDLEKAATTFLAGAGIVGLALGFAFQDLTANFIAGVFLAVRRPLRAGQLVETNSFLGTVETIELRSTVLRTLEGQMVRIPNRKIFEEPLVNFSELGRRRVDLEVGVSYGDDLEKVKRVTLEALSSLSRDTSEPLDLYFQEFGDSSINFTVRFWIPFQKQSDWLAARDQAVMVIHRAYAEHDITIPFPIRTLDFGIVGGEKLRDHLASVPAR